MPVEITMPRMSDTMEQGRIVRWLKAVGDSVSKGEALAEIETDKAVMQLESYAAGTLDKLLLNEGDSAPIGEPIALVRTAREGTAAPSSPTPVATSAPAAPASAAPASAAPAAEAPASTAPAAEAPAAPASPTAVPVATSTQSSPDTAQPAISQPAPVSVPASSDDQRIFASPIARRIAERDGVDLRQVKGTGPGSRVTRWDVESYQSSQPTARVTSAPPGPDAPAPQPAPAAAASTPRPATPAPASVHPAPALAEGDEIITLSRLRRTIADRMAESKSSVPHFYVTSEIDMAEALALRKRLNIAWVPDQVGVTDMIIRAVALALRKYPEVNSSYRPASAGQEPAVIRHAHANVGIAVALPDEGLFVPVVRDADLKGLREISKETKGLVERSRTGKPHSSDFGGGTFTISNLGMSDVEEFVAVITPPEAAILAVGSIKQVPVAVPAASGDGQFEVKVSPRMRVTLSGDHRVFAGETGAKFIQEVKRALQSPLDLLS